MYGKIVTLGYFWLMRTGLGWICYYACPAPLFPLSKIPLFIPCDSGVAAHDSTVAQYSPSLPWHQSWGPKCRHPAEPSRVPSPERTALLLVPVGKLGLPHTLFPARQRSVCRRKAAGVQRDIRKRDERRQILWWCLHFQSPRSYKILVLLFFFQSCVSSCEP